MVLWCGVETKDGRIRTFKRPKISEFGTVMLGGLMYTTDPRRQRRMEYRSIPFRLRRTRHIQVYAEGNPEPKPFYDVEELPDNRAGAILSTYARATNLRRMAGKGRDMVLLIMSIGFGLGIGMIVKTMLDLYRP